MRSKSWLTGLVAALAACEGGGSSERYFANLSGLQEVPAVTTNASGTATLAVRGSEVDFSVVVQSIAGVTAAHIHAGAPGEDGPAVVDLYSGPTTGVIANAVLATGTITSASLTALSMDSLLVLVRTGNSYVNVHTTSRPAGEIRGRFLP